MATLTYAYADRAVVLGPLATYAEPHSYDLCRHHAERMTAPRGWEVVRGGGEFSEPVLATDDLLALADAVREPGRPRPADRPNDPVPQRTVAAQGSASSGPPGEGEQPAREAPTRRRAHLRILRES